MALINCSGCGKQIKSTASFCSKCGQSVILGLMTADLTATRVSEIRSDSSSDSIDLVYDYSKLGIKNAASVETSLVEISANVAIAEERPSHSVINGANDVSNGDFSISKAPKLPLNLYEMGKLPVFSMTITGLTGKVNRQSCAAGFMPGWTIRLTRYENGLSISCDESSQNFWIHYAQIVSMQFLESVKVQRKEKSVIGRALIGGVLLGPVGAIVGGVSGVGAKEIATDGFQLNFWNQKTSRYDSLAVDVKANASLKGLCDFVQEQAKANLQSHLDFMT